MVMWKVKRVRGCKGLLWFYGGDGGNPNPNVNSRISVIVKGVTAMRLTAESPYPSTRQTARTADKHTLSPAQSLTSCSQDHSRLHRLLLIHPVT